MKNFGRASVVVVVFVFLFGLAGLNSALAATAPNLGDADSFSVLAATAVTNVPTSSIGGDMGLSPAAGSNYDGGVTSAQVSGTIYAVDATGPAGSVMDPGLLTTARVDLNSAYSALSAGDNADAFCDAGYQFGAGVVDLAGANLVPGVYCADEFILTGTLTLSGSGVWVFRSAATLTTSGTANVVGGDACSVWWEVASSATLGTDTSLVGNILALTSISMDHGASLNGRALARTGAVTLNSNTINAATCADRNEDEDEDEEDEDEDNEEVDIKVTKTANPSNLPSGPGSVTYTYWVTNRGDVALKDISVEDDKCSPVAYVSGDTNRNSKLGEDERWKYTCTKRVSGTETNTVTARGRANGEKVHDHDKATVTVSVPGFPGAGADLNEGINSLLNNLFQKAATFLAL